jgi:alpha-tubulin suppressor-like RCC1 family protein
VHSLALKQGGQVVSWGSRSDVPAAAASGVSAISAGGDHNLVLKNGGVLAWGNNTYGQTTVPAAAASGVSAISAGYDHSLALKNGGVIAWGRDNFHQVDVPAEAASGVVAIDAGWNHNVAVKADGTIVLWGSDISGESDPSACAPIFGASAGDGATFVLKQDLNVCQ